MTNIQGIILDWAGTAIDFGCFAPVEAFIKAFEAERIAVTVEEAREPMGMLKRDHIKAMLNMPRIQQEWVSKHGKPYEEADIERLFNHFEPHLMASLSAYTEPLPGVLPTVTKLRKMGLKIGSTTGYTDKMMAIVTDSAKAKGYAPDAWVSPDSTSGKGRPYPYMIFKNMELLGLASPQSIVKIGDTIADILEGRNASVWTVGVIVGSSVMGLTKEAYERLDAVTKDETLRKIRNKYMEAGAHEVIEDISELPQLIETINRQLEKGMRP